MFVNPANALSFSSLLTGETFVYSFSLLTNTGSHYLPVKFSSCWPRLPFFSFLPLPFACLLPTYFSSSSSSSILHIPSCNQYEKLPRVVSYTPMNLKSNVVVNFCMPQRTWKSNYYSRTLVKHINDRQQSLLYKYIHSEGGNFPPIYIQLRVCFVLGGKKRVRGGKWKFKVFTTSSVLFLITFRPGLVI